MSNHETHWQEVEDDSLRTVHRGQLRLVEYDTDMSTSSIDFDVSESVNPKTYDSTHVEGVLGAASVNRASYHQPHML